MAGDTKSGHAPAGGTLWDRMRAAFPRRLDAGYVPEVMWGPDPNSLGFVAPSHEYLGRLHRTEVRAQRQARRIADYYRRGPLRPVWVKVAYIKRSDREVHDRYTCTWPCR
jgi:hypothetical protein